MSRIARTLIFAHLKRKGTMRTLIMPMFFAEKIVEYQRTNGPVNSHLISGPTVSTKTSKIGQGQPRVIIYINFVELESPMLRAKFQDHSTSGSEEEEFYRFLPYMGMVAILVM